MLPNNLKIENELISLLVYYPECVPQVASIVTAKDFYHLQNQENFKIIIETFKSDGSIDLTKIQKIYDYDTELIGYVSPSFAKKLSTELRDISQKRSIITMVNEVQARIDEKTGSQMVEAIIKTLTKISSTVKNEHTDIKSIIEEVYNSWELTKGNDIIGLKTGYSKIDFAISGMQEGHLWVIGGYTNYGKSTFAISILCNLLKNYLDKSYLFCSLEMSKEQICQKIISNLLHDSVFNIRKNPKDERSLKARAFLETSKLEITDNLYTVEQLNLKINEMILLGNKPSVVFLDFIQNIQGEGKSEYEKITTAIIELQRLTKKYKICLVVLSQVNNQSADFKEVIGFKSSGALASAADITIQIIRNKVDEIKMKSDNKEYEFADMKLFVQKNRHGISTTEDLEFDISKGLIINH
jgi:replicative DNA helicase